MSHLNLEIEIIFFLFSGFNSLSDISLLFKTSSFPGEYVGPPRSVNAEKTPSSDGAECLWKSFSGEPVPLP